MSKSEEMKNSENKNWDDEFEKKNENQNKNHIIIIENEKSWVLCKNEAWLTMNLLI